MSVHDSRGYGVLFLSFVGLLSSLLAVSFGVACIEHRLLWGYAVEPPVAIQSNHCQHPWTVIGRRPASERPLLGLPSEFDGLLTRLRPDEVRSGQPISPESKLFLENSAVIQNREICLFLACTGAGPFGSACVSELPEDNDRYRYTEVLYATNATTVKTQVEWYFEISGLEFLTLGTLTGFNGFISICIAFGAGVRLSAQPREVDSS